MNLQLHDLESQMRANTFILYVRIRSSSVPGFLQPGCPYFTRGIGLAYDRNLQYEDYLMIC